MEKKELQDENSVLAAKISKLQSKLESEIKEMTAEIKERTAKRNLDLNLAPPECEQEALPSIVTPDYTSLLAYQKAQTMIDPMYAYPFLPDPQAYPAPDASASNSLALPASTVSKPLARYPTPTDAWSSQILGKRPRLETENQGGGSNSSSGGFCRS